MKEAYQSADHLRELIDTAAKMEGVVRNAGTHAAGVVISDKPLVEYLPLHRPTSNSEETPIKTVTQFEMGILEKLKMLKVDFLGLATLTIMARACDLIEQRHGVDYTLDNIPTDDPETYQFLGEGNTLGVFQLEGSGMTKWLVQMKPQILDNIIAMVALFRPGPMDFIPDYISRMHGETGGGVPASVAGTDLRRDLRHPALSGTDHARRHRTGRVTRPPKRTTCAAAISKKKTKEIEKHRHKFVAGRGRAGHAERYRRSHLHDWEEFARYGFNKSHAADYGVLAVANRLPETALPGGIHDRPALGDQARDREDGPLRQRCPQHGRGGPAAGCERQLLGFCHRGPSRSKNPPSALGWARSRMSGRGRWN